MADAWAHGRCCGNWRKNLRSAATAGSHGRRMGDVAGYNTNVEIKTIVSATISDQIMEALRPFQATHALIAFRQEVEGLFD